MTRPRRLITPSTKSGSQSGSQSENQLPQAYLRLGLAGNDLAQDPGDDVEIWETAIGLGREDKYNRYRDLT